MADEAANQIIRADGTSEERMPADGKEFSLPELQDAVGGYIELITITDGRFMVVNEEGLLKKLPMNMVASSLAHQIIVGDVLVCETRFIT